MILSPFIGEKYCKALLVPLVPVLSTTKVMRQNLLHQVFHIKMLLCGFNFEYSAKIMFGQSQLKKKL